MHQRADHGALQGREIVRGEVRQVAVLGVTPHGLDGVELGSIGGKPLDDDAAVLGQPGRDARGAVRAVPVPEEGEPVGPVALEGLEESENLRAADVVVSAVMQKSPLRVIENSPPPALLRRRSDDGGVDAGV